MHTTGQQHNDGFISPVRMSTWLMIAAFLIFGILQSVAAEPTKVIASVDKNPVIAGDSFILTVTVDDDVPTSSFDAAAQLPASFSVLNTRTARRTSMINNSFSRQTTFTVSVRTPSTPGEVEIPALTIESVQSEPITLRVLEAGSDAGAEERLAFIRTSISHQEVYVQQQVSIIARLYLAANLQSGNIIPPRLSDADIVQVGKDEETYEVIDGIRYQVFQRTYVVTPQRSGEQVIRGPVFEGQISTESGNSIFSAFSSTQSVTTAAQDIPLRVRPAPDNWQGEWFPAELATLSLEYVSDGEAIPSELTIGQPITLRFRLTAIGVKPEQLPALTLSPLTGANSYPEQPELSSTVRNGNMIAQKTVSVTIIPRDVGKLQIPAIVIPWFNTTTGQRQEARTEPLTFTVNAGSGLQPDIPQQSTDELSKQSDTPAPTTEKTALPSAKLSADSGLPWLWIGLSIAFASLWLATLFAFWRRGRPTQSTATTATTQSPDYWKVVQQSCLNNDSTAVIQALQMWARHEFDLTDNSLQGIKRYLASSPVTAQIDFLLAARFSAHPTNWQEGKALLRALQDARRQRVKQHSKSATQLPPLFPR
ncbi:MAG TPA: BatD family protein [Pseudidiomarina sp.]|nr:BatD family protein [Pseudidiomarina sp.]